ncbi:hypothetical protein GCM10025862_32880 [Arsenicicoccus piscis]|uniref:Uncharacterized protein n=1 Tax=Arsenicicoccus piscis TaxID=673954 RepID=A0ABQ6HSD2_9MICO|nr:hypothetical protein GCM10025862_32880 [Arsenicicoccus piscis]
MHPHPTLLGGVYEEQPAERPERLTAERLRRLLVQDQHRAPEIRGLGGGHQPGETGSDDDQVGVAVVEGGTGKVRSHGPILT